MKHNLLHYCITQKLVLASQIGDESNQGHVFSVDEKPVVHSFSSHYSVKDVLQRIGATDRGDAFYIVNLECLVLILYSHISPL